MGGKNLGGKSLTGREAHNIAEWVQRSLRDQAHVHLVGSARRGVAICGDVDLVVVPWNLEGVTQWIQATLGVALKDRKHLAWLHEGVQVELYIASADTLGAQMLTWTGSMGWNVRCRAAAKRRGYKLNQYGVFDASGTNLSLSMNEQEICALIGMKYREPSDR